MGSSDRKTLSPDYIELADKDNKGDASVVTVHVLTSPRDSLLQQATRRSPPPMMLDSLGPSCAYQAKDHEPTAKEKALAEAARARLYGGKVKSVEEKPKLPSGPEPAAVEVTYLERSQVASAEGPEKPVEVLLEGCLACGLPSKEWTESVAALNQLRQFSVHHSSILQPRLDQAMPLVLKHIKSLRSSVCKTALLCLSDLFVDFGDRLIPLLDVGGMERPATSMLCQLLLKASSNDKKFVIEEAERCLGGMCKHLSPAPLLPLVLPYIQHRVPMVRGNAGACVATVISQSVSSGSDLASHLRTAGRLVTDKTPMAREAARSIIASVHREWDRQHPGDDSLAWESFCRSELSASCAAAVLKAAM